MACMPLARLPSHAEDPFFFEAPHEISVPAGYNVSTMLDIHNALLVSEGKLPEHPPARAPPPAPPARPPPPPPGQPATALPASGAAATPTSASATTSLPTVVDVARVTTSATAGPAAAASGRVGPAAATTSRDPVHSQETVIAGPSASALGSKLRCDEMLDVQTRIAALAPEKRALISALKGRGGVPLLAHAYTGTTPRNHCIGV